MIRRKHDSALEESTSDQNDSTPGPDGNDSSSRPDRSSFWSVPSLRTNYSSVQGPPNYSAAATSAAVGQYTIVPVTNGGMTFNLEFVNADNPTASFESAVEQAASILSAYITNQITVNIIIDYKGTGQGASAIPDNSQNIDYSTVRTALQAAATDGSSSLPSGNSISGYGTTQGYSQVTVWNAELKALGLGSINPNDSTTDDGSASFNIDIPPSSVMPVALHELTHALGRVPGGVPGFSGPDVMELFSFSSAGNRAFLTGGRSTGFSLDGGNTKLALYGRTSDVSDFLNSSAPEDPFDEFYDDNTFQYLTALDLRQLSALGFTINTPPLFTSGADTVDFNNLTSAQAAAVLVGADIYHGLGENDVVILPTLANYNESVGSGGSLGWTNTSASTFYTESKPGDTCTVSGEDGNYYISAGGGTDDITISGSGRSVIFAGSGTLNASIAGGGALTISGGFTGTEIASSGGTLSVTAGQQSGGIVVLSGGTLDVFAGGTASGVIVSGGGKEFAMPAGAIVGTTVASGGFAYVKSGGTVTSAFISGGGSGVISGGGTAIDTTVASGGSLLVQSKGVADPITVLSGGVEIVSRGGTDVGAQVSGQQQAFGVAVGATVLAGSQLVESAGTASGTTVSSGGSELVLKGGRTSGTTVWGGGTLVVSSGGTAGSTMIESGGTEIVSRGGSDLRAQISGGEQDLSGYASGTIVAVGLQSVASGGTASSTRLSSGGSEVLFRGGTGRSTVVGDGGAIINSGGFVLSGVVSGGVSSGALVLSGGTASATILRSGGVEIVGPGAFDRATIISTGALDVITSGGSTSASVISGGTEEFGSGAIISGTVTFGSGGGTLRIDSPTMPGNTITGLAPGDTIDLAGVAFDSGGAVQVISGRVLRVVENSTTYNLNLTSSSKYSTYHFGLAADANGGSEVIVTAMTSGGTAGNARPAAVSKVSSAAAASSNGVSDHVDHRAHHGLVFRDGTGADSNFFWVNSNGDFGGWTGLSNSAPDLLFRNGVAEDPGLRRLGGNATVPSWYDIASENIAGASAALANETGTAAADLLYLGGTSDVGSRNMTADVATPAEDSTLRREDVSRSSTAYKIVR